MLNIYVFSANKSFVEINTEERKEYKQFLLKEDKLNQVLWIKNQ